MAKRNPLEIPQGISLFDYGSETLVIERTDDVISASYEPVRVYELDGVAVTGLQHAADYLGVHVNTVRRYADKGLLESARYPSGVRRIRVDSLKAVRDQMFGEVDDSQAETEENTMIVDVVQKDLLPRLASSERGGKPSDPNWTMYRLIPMRREETWQRLQEAARQASTSERKVAAGQIAAFLIELAVEEYAFLLELAQEECEE